MIVMVNVNELCFACNAVLVVYVRNEDEATATNERSDVNSRWKWYRSNLSSMFQRFEVKRSKELMCKNSVRNRPSPLSFVTGLLVLEGPN